MSPTLLCVYGVQSCFVLEGRLNQTVCVCVCVTSSHMKQKKFSHWLVTALQVHTHKHTRSCALTYTHTFETFLWRSLSLYHFMLFKEVLPRQSTKLLMILCRLSCGWCFYIRYKLIFPLSRLTGLCWIRYRNKFAFLCDCLMQSLHVQSSWHDHM